MNFVDFLLYIRNTIIKKTFPVDFSMQDLIELWNLLFNLTIYLSINKLFNCCIWRFSILMVLVLER